ncbi:hypothetical protein [Pseudoxanthomonas sp. 10H]|uniref:hypothetical protein n=1 Tax=Pseudoxanthomonas sp. 10H TaxID=3242729 RepID=UPI0035560BEA
MKSPPLAIVASALLAACASTPPRASLLHGNVLKLEGGYLTVPTPEGDRPLRDGGCSRFRLVGDKDDYLPGEIFLSDNCYGTGPDGVDGITSHYRGGIHFDRERKRVVIDIRFADGTPMRQNGTYRYVDLR